MNSRHPIGGQRGFALVMAIVLLMLIASLAVVMSRMAVSSSASAALSLRHERALSAARAGIAWGRYAVLNSGSCVNETFTLEGINLPAFEVQVSCTQTTHRISNQDVKQFLLTANSSAGSYGAASYVSRSVEALISDD